VNALDPDGPVRCAPAAYPQLSMHGSSDLFESLRGSDDRLLEQQPVKAWIQRQACFRRYRTFFRAMCLSGLPIGVLRSGPKRSAQHRVVSVLVLRKWVWSLVGRVFSVGRSLPERLVSGVGQSGRFVEGSESIGRRFRFVTSKSRHQSARTGCPAGVWLDQASKADSLRRHQACQVRDTGFLARRGLVSTLARLLTESDRRRDLRLVEVSGIGFVLLSSPFDLTG